MNKYELAIAELEKKFKAEKRQLEEKIKGSKLRAIPENVREVAEILHSKLCRRNHTDGCGWYYDNGDWTEYSRKEYVKKAEDVLNITDRETIEKLIKVI